MERKRADNWVWLFGVDFDGGLVTYYKYIDDIDVLDYCIILLS